MNIKLAGIAILITTLMLFSPSIIGVMANGASVIYSETFYGRVNVRYTETYGGMTYTGTDWEMAYITVTVYDNGTVKLFFDFYYWTETYYGRIRRMVNTSSYLFIAAFQRITGEGDIRIRMFILITPSGLDLRLSMIGYMTDYYDAPSQNNVIID